MTVPALKVTKGDRDRLASAAIAALRHERRSSASASMLLSEVARAVVIESDTPSPHVVAPHRDVEIYDNITNTNRRLQLVYPGEDDSDPAAVSVLSPLGAALIGLSVGDTFDWCNVYGDRHSVTVLRV